MNRLDPHQAQGVRQYVIDQEMAQGDGRDILGAASQADYAAVGADKKLRHIDEPNDEPVGNAAREDPFLAVGTATARRPLRRLR